MADHKFIVSNGRIDGRDTLETESYREAADYQYRMNCLNTSVGLAPNFTLWLIDEDGIEVRVNTQL